MTAAFPDLHLRIWCNIRGVQVVCYVDRSDSQGRLHRTTIANTSFRPPEVTEELVISWAIRCLSRWAADHYVVELKGQVSE